MEIAFLIGRIIVGVYYLLGASNHFLQTTALTNSAASKGVPAPKAAVLSGGVLLLVGGLSILTGVQPGIGVLALVLFFVPVTLIMGIFAYPPEMVHLASCSLFPCFYRLDGALG